MCWCALTLPLQDAIVPFVMPFVTENIGKKATPEDWRLREAATFAFGSMLEGPSPATMAEIVRQAMGFLLAVSLLLLTSTEHWEALWPGRPGVLPSHNVWVQSHALQATLPTPRAAAPACLQAMKDPHPYVRDTTAWTISRVFEFQHDAGDANVPELITRETLPQVAQVCCVPNTRPFHQACVLS